MFFVKGVFLGKGETSFREKRSFSLPQTPSLFKKSGILLGVCYFEIMMVF
jgi:hypothetical protein